MTPPLNSPRLLSYESIYTTKGVQAKDIMGNQVTVGLHKEIMGIPARFHH